MLKLSSIFSKENCKIFFKILILVLILATIVIITLPKESFKIMEIRNIGKKLGSLSAILFCLSITTGIINRFQNLKISTLDLGQKIFQRIKPLGSYLMYSRTQIGIAMFVSALSHYVLITIIPIIKYGRTVQPQSYLTFGFLALFLSFWLAITSNWFSKKLLKTNWKRLHSLVYIIVWLIFLHVALIDLSLISVIVLFFAILETTSLFYRKFNKSSHG